MGFLTCDCANVHVYTTSKDTILTEFTLSSSLKPLKDKDPFFQHVSIQRFGLGGLQMEQPLLTTERSVDSWKILRCKNCEMDIHAYESPDMPKDETLLGNGQIFVSMALACSEQEHSRIRSRATYSPVYKLCIDSSLYSGDVSPNISRGPLSDVYTDLDKKMQMAIKNEERAIKDRIKQYELAQMELLKAFQVRAKKDKVAVFFNVKGEMEFRQKAYNSPSSNLAPPSHCIWTQSSDPDSSASQDSDISSSQDSQISNDVSVTKPVILLNDNQLQKEEPLEAVPQNTETTSTNPSATVNTSTEIGPANEEKVSNIENKTQNYAGTVKKTSQSILKLSDADSKHAGSVRFSSVIYQHSPPKAEAEALFKTDQDHLPDINVVKPESEQSMFALDDHIDETFLKEAREKDSNPDQEPSDINNIDTVIHGHWDSDEEEELHISATSGTSLPAPSLPISMPIRPVRTVLDDNSLEGSGECNGNEGMNIAQSMQATILANSKDDVLELLRSIPRRKMFSVL